MVPVGSKVPRVPDELEGSEALNCLIRRAAAEQRRPMDFFFLDRQRDSI